ncbi:acyltransferase domain-containing protein [Chromobacterium piscinae]|uniref:acyltransferase domain-containing protein n=1 Tax=Chromobacterium piscinae TaxID=686831 RepID=UPI00140D8EB9|nr:acyltransferase domain-containing protein [Chromobacterium piscinae]MBX9298715.1 acyltransferase domain-containing protein [Chromobacterium vaccinii]MBX9357296.1 acyltransferase domain-containing protein [Chromobacterium vaccinii]MCD5329200.1 acyltransferase domain-containing protein [Chromobacterium piscinae]NHQ82121.1 acyltransferase domain-containing protein [Chromobacterium vaccinii]
MKPVIFMASGQGSQYFQMGVDLYNENEYFYEKINTVGLIIENRFGISIVDIIYDDKRDGSEIFSDPILSSLGIYIIEYALVSTLEKYGVQPTKIIASSLGIFISSVISRCLDSSQALDTIYSMMSLLNRRCDEGCMIIVLADPTMYYRSSMLKEKTVLASRDDGLSFAISLQLCDLMDVENYLNDIGAAFHRLPVSRAYHSHWMDHLKNEFMRMDLNFLSNKPSIPLICCARTDELLTIGMSDFWNAVRRPLLFSDTIAKAEKEMAACYIDIGPSGMMATNLKYVLPKSSKSEIYTILNQQRRASKNLENVIKHCR